MEEGGLLDETIDRHFSSPWVPSAYKPLIYEIASGVVRWKLYLDWVLSHLVKEGLKKDVRHLLWMSLYQVFFMKKAVYHVVNEAVDYAKKEKGQGMANFVNAVLRRAIRERDELPMPTDPVARLSIAYSFPSWLVRRWCARFGEKGVEELLALLNKSPEFTLRIDPRKITREEAVRRLADLGVKAVKGRFLEKALIVDRVGPLLDSELLKDHLLHVQDETSQMAGLAVAPSPGGPRPRRVRGTGHKDGPDKGRMAVGARRRYGPGWEKASRHPRHDLSRTGGCPEKPFKKGAF